MNHTSVSTAFPPLTVDILLHPGQPSPAERRAHESFRKLGTGWEFESRHVVCQAEAEKIAPSLLF